MSDLGSGHDLTGFMSLSPASSLLLSVQSSLCPLEETHIKCKDAERLKGKGNRTKEDAPVDANKGSQHCCAESRQIGFMAKSFTRDKRVA